MMQHVRDRWALLSDRSRPHRLHLFGPHLRVPVALFALYSTSPFNTRHTREARLTTTQNCPLLSGVVGSRFMLAIARS